MNGAITIFRGVRTGGLLPVLLLTVLLVQGCATIGSLPFMPAEQQVEAALARDDYGRALELVDRHDLEPAEEWEHRRDEIAEKARAEADEAMQTARQMSAEGEVARALEVLEAADTRLPPDDEREQFMQQLEQQRQIGLKNMTQRHELLEARALAQRMRVLEVMRPLARSRDQLPADPQHLARRAQELAQAMDRRAEKSARRERLELLQLAQDLAPEPGRAREIARLEQDLRAGVDANGVSRAEKEAAINARLRQALDNGDLHKVAQWCREEVAIDSRASGPDQAAQRGRQALCEEWREKRDRHAESLLEEGRGHYTAGQIEDALATWEEGLELAPEHSGLMAARERALRVIERLETLRLPEAGSVEEAAGSAHEND